MALRVGINGFGRIGRLVLRALVESGRDDVKVVGINDLGSVEMNAHLLKYDSVHGTFQNDIDIDKDTMAVGAGPWSLDNCCCKKEACETDAAA